MTKLTESQIETALQAVPEWGESGDAIQRTFQFSDFVKAMSFVDRVAQAAEQNRHHPDILIRYNKVTLTLSTHDAGGISMKDFELAKVCDQYFETYGPPPLPPSTSPSTPSAPTKRRKA
ncbi:MAG: 4a-hydroxytetrahydrobiopterin dehydratase [Phycisphaeraceae bacterium]|nr:4a-hydroxytetrahydrobiopterin dehydratase [Phycisphaeraceae bacterium]